jgi:hypothetical protein
MFRPAQGGMQGINNYVPAMQWSASVDVQAGSVFSLGKPVAPVASAPITIPLGVAQRAFLTTPIVLTDTPYGRNIVVAVTTAPTGATALKVFGEDYLGQPITEQFAVAGATGKKAFYRILGASVVGTSSADGVITITHGALLGLPFKGTVEYAKEGAPPVLLDPAGMFAKCVAPDVTDPATATTGDPRGMYTPTGAPDGLKEYIVVLRVDMSYNASNNGGLHGIRHFNG